MAIYTIVENRIECDHCGADDLLSRGWHRSIDDLEREAADGDWHQLVENGRLQWLCSRCVQAIAKENESKNAPQS